MALDEEFARRLLDAITRNNAYWEKYGPMLEEMWTRRSELATKRGPMDYLGEALKSGRLDGLVDAVSRSMGGRGVAPRPERDPTAPNPRPRRRSR